jgi:hypothetical protein
VVRGRSDLCPNIQVVHFAWSDDHHDDRLFPVLWLVRTSVSGCNGSSDSHSNVAIIIVCCPSPLHPCVYKYGGSGRSSGYANSLSDALHSPFPSHLLQE